MLKKLALATVAVGLLMSTASADSYIVQVMATKKCKVFETRPTETTWIQVGPAAFKTQTTAEKQIKTVCRNTTMLRVSTRRGRRYQGRSRQVVSFTKIDLRHTISLNKLSGKYSERKRAFCVSSGG